MINKGNFANETDMPLGLSMAMAQNPHLLNVFMSLSPLQRESLVGTLANTAADVSRLTDLADSADIGKG